MDNYQRNIHHFMAQFFHSIQSGCVENNTLFEDEYFLPNNDSLFLRKPPVSIEWKRPREICDDPRFTVSDPSMLDIYPGEFGSSSFVVSCSILASHDDFWNRVVPDADSQTNSLSVDSAEVYCGICRFRFWRFGLWCEVVIDDRLPTLNGRLYGVRASQHNVLWYALMEKAYAKLLGCYEAMHYLSAGCILQDMTGCILHDIQLSPAIDNPDMRNKVFKDLSEAETRGRAMLTCWIRPPVESIDSGKESDVGLIIGHFYAVKLVKEIQFGKGLLRLAKSDKIRLVKLHNPTSAKQWTGAWSENSEEWNAISESERRRVGLTCKKGEFWMSFEDFCFNFTDVSVCRFLPSRGLIRELWMESWCHGTWTPDLDPNANTAGGSLQMSKETFLQNPQFRFDISDETKSNVIIQLQQKEWRIHSCIQPQAMRIIGIRILKIESNRLFKMHKYFEDGNVTASSYANNRSIVLHTRLSKGRYAVIPTTYEPGVNGEYLLRIYSEAHVNFNALMYDYPPKSCWAFCIGYPLLVTRVRVVEGRNCKRLQGGAVGNAYVLISCEGQFVRSKTFKNNKDPAFDTRAVFYRKKPANPIVFTVYYDGGLFCDKFIGQGSIDAAAENVSTSVEIPLFGRGNLSGKKYPGTLMVDVASFEDIHSL